MRQFSERPIKRVDAYKEYKPNAEGSTAGVLLSNVNIRNIQSSNRRRVSTNTPHCAA